MCHLWLNDKRCMFPFTSLHGTVSRDGLGFWCHVWLVLGLNRGRDNLLNFLCSDDFILKKVYFSRFRNWVAKLQYIGCGLVWQLGSYSVPSHRSHNLNNEDFKCIHVCLLEISKLSKILLFVLCCACMLGGGGDMNICSAIIPAAGKSSRCLMQLRFLGGAQPIPFYAAGQRKDIRRGVMQLRWSGNPRLLKKIIIRLLGLKWQIFLTFAE